MKIRCCFAQALKFIFLPSFPQSSATRRKSVGSASFATMNQFANTDEKSKRLVFVKNVQKETNPVRRTKSAARLNTTVNRDTMGWRESACEKIDKKVLFNSQRLTLVNEHQMEPICSTWCSANKAILDSLSIPVLNLQCGSVLTHNFKSRF